VGRVCRGLLGFWADPWHVACELDTTRGAPGVPGGAVATLAPRDTGTPGTLATAVLGTLATGEVPSWAPWHIPS